MLGSLIIYLKGMRRMMFQLSGFYYKACGFRVWGLNVAKALSPKALNTISSVRPWLRV